MSQKGVYTFSEWNRHVNKLNHYIRQHCQLVISKSSVGAQNDHRQLRGTVDSGG